MGARVKQLQFSIHDGSPRGQVNAIECESGVSGACSKPQSLSCLSAFDCLRPCVVSAWFPCASILQLATCSKRCVLLLFVVFGGIIFFSAKRCLGST